MRIKRHFSKEIRNLLYINEGGKSWQLAAILTLCTGIPLFIGTYFNNFGFGVISSIGGMGAFYIQKTPIIHRIVTLLCVSAGLSASFFIGLIVAHFPYLLLISISIIGILATMICRIFRIPPPANYFFVMAASIAAFIPHPPHEIPTMVGLVFLGSLFAVVLVFVYSLISLRINPKTLPVAGIESDFQEVIVDPVIIGCFVGLAIFLGQFIGLEKPYWVALTCLAVVQGMTFSAIWSRHLQRIVGTFIGLWLTWLLLELELGLWYYSLLLSGLTFLVQYLSSRNYAAATIFVTPLTIFLAEYAHRNIDPNLLVQARLFDTILGSSLGVLAGLAIHSSTFRAWLTQILQVLIPYKIE